MKKVFLMLYYGFAYFLPDSIFPGGGAFRRIRGLCCRRLFAEMGVRVNMESRVFVADGRHIRIGSDFWLGTGSRVYGAVIGQGVLVAPTSSSSRRTTGSMRSTAQLERQGNTEVSLPVVEDWARIASARSFFPAGGSGGTQWWERARW
jgi:hypothetical protein